jgi:hypothetical protein
MSSEENVIKFTDKGAMRCVGRKCVKANRGYVAEQCARACAEDSELCKTCIERQAKNLTGATKLPGFHGMYGDKSTLPKWSAIYKRRTTAKAAAMAARSAANSASNAVAGAGAPPAAKRAAKTAKKAAKAATDAVEEGAAAVAAAEKVAVAAEKEARRAAEKAEKEARRAAEKAEKEARKAAAEAEKEARKAERATTAKRSPLPSNTRMTAKQRANAQRRLLRNAYRVVKAGKNINTRMAADAYKMLRLTEMDLGNAGRNSNTNISRKSSSSRLMYSPVSDIRSNNSAGYASAASGSAPRPARRPASAASPIGSEAFESEKRRAAQNAALAALMTAQGPANLY